MSGHTLFNHVDQLAHVARPARSIRRFIASVENARTNGLCRSAPGATGDLPVAECLLCAPPVRNFQADNVEAVIEIFAEFPTAIAFGRSR